MTTKLGFIGMGIMGRPMAFNLLKAGFDVAVYSRRPESCKAVTEQGAVYLQLPDIAKQCDIIFICVSDTPDVAQVIRDLTPHLKPNTIVVDMSTISPTATKQLAEDLKKINVHMLDAPVSGGETGAINGTLSIMVGGDADVVELVLPYFKAMGKNIVHIGGHGAGQVAKVCNQIVVGVTIEAVAEALTVAQKSGVDAAKVREALLGGFAGSKILEIHGNRMLSDNYTPGFTAKLHRKDMGIVLDTAKTLGLTLKGAEIFTRHLDNAVAAGNDAEDSSVIFKGMGSK